MSFMSQANAAEVGTGVSAGGTIAGGSQPPSAGPGPQATLVSEPEPDFKTAETTNPRVAQVFDEKVRGTPLEGRWGDIETAAKKHGMKPALVAGIIAHESGNGSTLKGNNPGGIMDPAKNWERKKEFPSIKAGIEATAGVIAKNFVRAGGDMAKLAEIYAPVGAKNDKQGLNRDWLPGVQKQMSYFQ